MATCELGKNCVGGGAGVRGIVWRWYSICDNLADGSCTGA